MSERPSAERLAFLREQLRLQPGVPELFIELDAVTRERDEMRDSLGVVISKNYDLTRERDEARTVTDEMVERAAVEIFDEASHLIMWPDTGSQHHYRILARRALTAALGGDK